MLEVLKKCFGGRLDGSWLAKIKEMIPSYGESLIDDAKLCQQIRSETAELLQIKCSPA
jgi:malate dehydrogenase (quinone)